MFFIYILKSLVNESYYIGSCKNIDKRFHLHNAGQVISTKRYIPWKLVYSEKYKTLSRAVKRERQIKSWKSKVAIERLVKRYMV